MNYPKPKTPTRTDVLLSSGRIAKHRLAEGHYGEMGVHDVYFENDPQHMTKAEWKEYCAIAKASNVPAVGSLAWKRAQEKPK